MKQHRNNPEAQSSYLAAGVPTLSDADRDEQREQAEQAEQAEYITCDMIVDWFQRQGHFGIDPETRKSPHYQLGYLQGVLVSVLNSGSTAARYRASILEMAKEEA